MKEEALVLKKIYEDAIDLMKINKSKFKDSKRAGDKYLYRLLSNVIEILENSRDSIDA